MPVLEFRNQLDLNKRANSQGSRLTTLSNDWRLQATIALEIEKLKSKLLVMILLSAIYSFRFKY